jgi:hypothetical protein
MSQCPVIDGGTGSQIQTVFLILMENHDWSDIKAHPTSATHILNDILPYASHAEQYYNPPGIHPSEPNYLWIEAGTNFGILNDLSVATNHQSTTAHLVTLLKNAGISWRSYQEDISGTVCPLTGVANYVPRHNPNVFFDDSTGNRSTTDPYCIAHNRPFSELQHDLDNATVARYNFITPNLCNDMHDTCPPLNDSIAQGDQWLNKTVNMIKNARCVYPQSAIFITWDEGEGDDGPIGMIVLSPFAKGGGYSNTIHYTHSSLLRTLQIIFNVRPFLGDAARVDGGTYPVRDLGDLFTSFP